jgi:hypothetical protein
MMGGMPPQPMSQAMPPNDAIQEQQKVNLPFYVLNIQRKAKAFFSLKYVEIATADASFAIDTGTNFGTASRSTSPSFTIGMFFYILFLLYMENLIALKSKK